MSKQPHENRPLRLTTHPGQLPSVSKVSSSLHRVYWGPQQPEQLSEPPNYAPPVDWPKLHYPIIPPRVVRIFVLKEQPSGDPDTCRAFERSFEQVEGQPPFGFVYCACDDLDVEMSWDIPGFDDPVMASVNEMHFEFLNGEFNAQGHPGLAFTGEADVDIGNCPDNGLGHDGGEGDPAAKARREAWENSEDTIRHAIEPVDYFFKVIDPEVNYLTWISVGEGFAPENPNDVPFIPGRPICGVVFVDKKADGEYDPGTVRDEPEGVRIIRASPVFPSSLLALIDDMSGITQLPDIAAAFSDSSMIFYSQGSLSPVDVVTALTDQLYGSP